MEKVFIEFIKWCMMPYVVTLCLILLIGFIWAVRNGKWVIFERAKIMARPMSRFIDLFAGKLPQFNNKKEGK